MKAIVLAAGQGRRLLPWTHDLPKCLLPFHGRPLIAWQLDALSKAGVDEVVVVTGFAAPAVDQALAELVPPGLSVRTVYNPFFAVAENIASCWMIREELLVGEVAVLNGDVLFEPAVLQRVRAQALRPLTVTIDRKNDYDADDMKVQTAGDRLLRIGKTLSEADGESIGLLLLRGLGGHLFIRAVESILRQPGGVSRWYLSAVDELAIRGVVGAVPIVGLSWTEVDYPADLARAEMLARAWSEGRRPMLDPTPKTSAEGQPPAAE